MGLILEGSQPLLPSGGTSLPTATGAGQVPLSDGAGTAYTATSLGLGGLMAARPAASAALLGRSYYATDIAPAGAISVCITDGAGGFGWTSVALDLSSEAQGTAAVMGPTGELVPTSADVSAVLAATDAAAARTALGVTAASHTTGALSARPVSPAAGDTYYASDFDVTLRCYVAGTWRIEGGDPLNMGVGPFATNSRFTGAVNGSHGGPIGGPGYSLALGLHVTSLPGSTECVLIHCGGIGLGSGWVLGVAKSGGTADTLYLQQAGISAGAKIELTGALLTTGSWALALSIAASEIRWSINGGAAGTVAISGTFTPSDKSASALGGFSADNLSVTWGKLHWFQAWASTLGDAALQAISAEHATYLPGASGASPVGAWLAARSRRDAGYQEMVGSQGLVYAPTNPAGCGRSVS